LPVRKPGVELGTSEEAVVVAVVGSGVGSVPSVDALGRSVGTLPSTGEPRYEGVEGEGV
jgi:hypothetical protein